MDARSTCDNCGQEEDHHTLLALYKVGYAQEYKVPSFPVVTVQLREIIYQFIADDCSTMMYTGYVWDCSMVNRPFPALAKVCCGNSDICYVEKAEFNKVINIDKKDLWQDRVLVLWNWIWVLPTDSDSDEDSTLIDKEGSSSDNDEHPDHEELESQHTHCITFKCIGATK